MDSQKKEKLKLPSEFRTDPVVLSVRILVTLATIVGLYLGNSTDLLIPLSVYLVFSEIVSQFLIYLARSNKYVNFFKFFYVLNSVLAISIVAFTTQWIFNDYYLVYLIGISSTILMFGFKAGLFSFILSVLAYGTLLYINQASPQTFLRLPVLSLVFLKLLLSQYRFEKIENFLKNFLDIEKTKQDFIALASHNLRTPISAIYGYIEVLLRGDPGALSEAQTNYIKKIKMNNQELEKITESLLEISIFEIGTEVNLLKQPSQIEIIIQTVVERFLPQAKEKGLALEFQKEPGILPLVNIDVDKITTALSNLIDNAIKYTAKGVVSVSAFKTDDFINVVVKDTGTGIPQEDLPKVFTKFFRSGNILTYNQTGTGLGLYLGKRIIELHGGSISISSVINRGTTIKFTLPVIKDEVL